MKYISLFIISGFLVIFSSCSNAYREDLGVTQNKIFTDCPDTPNCVSSTVDKDNKKYIKPIVYTGTLTEAKNKLRRILKRRKTLMLIEESDKYIHAEVRSFIFKFVDDLEFYFPKNKKLIYLKSGARIGYTDFGVNRKRLEKIREDFND